MARVEEGGLFRDMPLSDLLDRAQQVQFRHGWEDFSTWLADQPAVSADIISVGWSATFIRRALDTHTSHPSAIGRVYANELETASDMATGKLTKKRTLQRPRWREDGHSQAADHAGCRSCGEGVCG